MPPVATGGIVTSPFAVVGEDDFMKLSEFDRAVIEEFGAFGRVLRKDTVVVELGNRTPDEALAAGVPVRDVWLALCRVQDVPPRRWHGVGRPTPPRG
jgi:hypothetical protein